MNWVNIGSGNGLSPVRRQAIMRTNAGLLSIEPLGTKFGEILIEIHTFSFTKMRLKMSPAKLAAIFSGVGCGDGVGCGGWGGGGGGGGGWGVWGGGGVGGWGVK